jgi:hypothetical protein
MVRGVGCTIRCVTFRDCEETPISWVYSKVGPFRSLVRGARSRHLLAIDALPADRFCSALEAGLRWLDPIGSYLTRSLGCGRERSKLRQMVTPLLRGVVCADDVDAVARTNVTLALETFGGEVRCRLIWTRKARFRSLARCMIWLAAWPTSSVSGL